MQSIELTKPLTTESLLKEFESRFNMTMDLTKFNEVELQDYANHVRTHQNKIAIARNTLGGEGNENNSGMAFGKSDGDCRRQTT